MKFYLYADRSDSKSCDLFGIIESTDIEEVFAYGIEHNFAFVLEKSKAKELLNYAIYVENMDVNYINKSDSDVFVFCTNECGEIILCDLDDFITNVNVDTIEYLLCDNDILHKDFTKLKSAIDIDCVCYFDIVDYTSNHDRTYIDGILATMFYDGLLM